MRVVGVILGIMLITCGMWCMLTPFSTFETLSWLIGAVMMAEGIGAIMNYAERRSMGLADGWTLASGVASLVLGIFICCSFVLRVGVGIAVAILVAIWLIVVGMARIVAALDLRKVHDAGSAIGRNWVLVMVTGVVTLAFGIICVIHPLLAMESVGITMGLGITSCGLSVLLGSITVTIQ